MCRNEIRIFQAFRALKNNNSVQYYVYIKFPYAISLKGYHLIRSCLSCPLAFSSSAERV